MATFYVNRVELEGDVLSKEGPLIEYVMSKNPELDGDYHCLSFESILPTPEPLLKYSPIKYCSMTDAIIQDMSKFIESIYSVYADIYAYIHSLGKPKDRFEYFDRDADEQAIRRSALTFLTEEGFTKVKYSAPSGEPYRGSQYLDIIKKYGAIDWYDWRLHNWGTESDAVSPKYDPKLKQFIFMTETMFPSPIFVELSKQFSELVFKCAYAVHPSKGDNAGKCIIRNGHMVPYAFVDDGEKARLIESLWAAMINK